MSKEFVVNVPVADLRSKRVLPVGVGKRDPYQETQLLLGEEVVLLERVGSWARVECPEQPRCIDGRWGGYLGWVRIDALIPKRQTPNATVQLPWVAVQGVALSMGSRLLAEELDPQRLLVLLPDGRRGVLPKAALTPPHSLAATATAFLGAQYLWGGRSAHAVGSHTSVDCSGLTNLVYRAHGKRLPRNACDQARFCRQVEKPEPGDLVFLASRKDPTFVDHVMLYLEEDQLIEATVATGHVRQISWQERMHNQTFTIGRP